MCSSVLIFTKGVIGAHAQGTVKDSRQNLYSYNFQRYDLPPERTKAHINNIYKKGDRKNSSNFWRSYGEIDKNRIEEMKDIEE